MLISNHNYQKIPHFIMIQTRLQKLPSFSTFKKSIIFLYLNNEK
jgi:hypothetical protein